LELLGRFPAGKPWHLVINFAGPHDPLDITARMKETVKDRQFPPPRDSTQLTPEVHNQIRQNYTAMVENIDRWVGIYIDELKRRGEFENTIFAFSSDHGEMLGDLNRWAKNVPYEASVCVPLTISGPGIKARKSDALVSIPDLAATFLDYANARPTSRMTARSLRPLLEGRTNGHRQYITSGLYDWRMVCDGRYKLVRGFDPRLPSPLRSRPDAPTGPLLLFDLQNDPCEKMDIAAANPKVVARLKKRLSQPEPASGLSTFVSRLWRKR
jgi:arylsulfatase A-like enzyme